MSVLNYPRSPKALLGGLAHLGRMIDKVHLRHAGKIPDYNYLTVGFDQYLLDLLGVQGHAFEARVLEGGSDDEILEWVRSTGRPLSAEELRQWNDRISSSGPQDEAARRRFQARLAEAAAHRGIPLDQVPPLTSWCDIIDFDEGRL